MRINLIYYLYELNGAYTTFEDMFYNLKRYTDNDIRFIVLYEDKNIFTRFKEYLAFGEGIAYLQIKKQDRNKNVTRVNFTVNGEVNIISTEVMQLESKGYFSQTAEKIYLLYPAFVYKEESKEKEFFEYQMKYIKEHNVITICNKFNAKYVDNAFIWYIKFSQERINKLKNLVTATQDTLVAEDYYKEKMLGHNIKPFSYRNYKYYRYDKKNDNNLYTAKGARYYENIGKLMFEFVLLGKTSIYLPKNKPFDDGLTEFMQHLGFDDTQEYHWGEQDLEYLESKLYMNENDEILALFKEG